jgi:hypothetical protein
MLESEFIFINLWRMPVNRYHQMIMAGILTENDRLELLEGLLVKKVAISPAHSFVTDHLRDELMTAVSPHHFVRSQQPITTHTSEPEPDVMIIKGNQRRFIQHHPQPHDVLLIIEVADTTLHQDQTWKKRIYAQASIAIYWIVNLPDRQIEVYSQPSGPSDNPTYHQLHTYQETDEIPLILNRQEITHLKVRDLLP